MQGIYDNFVVHLLVSAFASITLEFEKKQPVQIEFEHKNTNVSIWHVGIIFIGVPTKSQDFVGKRRSSGASEFSLLGGNERYGACDDVQGLGKATPQQDSA